MMQSKINEHYWIKELSRFTAADYLMLNSLKDKKDTNKSQINIEVSEDILRICKGSDINVFVYLLSATNVLFERYFGVRSILNTPSIQLSDEDVSVTNSLSFVTRPIENLTFKSYFLEIRNFVLESYKHQSVNMDELKDRIINSDSNIESAFNLYACSYNGVHKDSINSDVCFNFLRKENTLQLEIESCLFDKDHLEQLVRHYHEIITAVVKDSATVLRDIELSIISHTKQKEQNINNELFHSLKESFDLYSQTKVFESPNRIITYMGLNHDSDHLGLAIQKDNAKCVCFYGLEFPENLIGACAAIKSGVKYLFLEKCSSSELFDAHYKLTEFDLVICQTKNDLPENYKGRSIVFDTIDFTEKTLELVSPKSESTLLYSFYSMDGNLNYEHTSETNLAARANSFIKKFNIDKNSIVGTLGDVNTYTATQDLWVYLLSGSTINAYPLEKSCTTETLNTFINEYNLSLLILADEYFDLDLHKLDIPVGLKTHKMDSNIKLNNNSYKLFGFPESNGTMMLSDSKGLTFVLDGYTVSTQNDSGTTQMNGGVGKLLWSWVGNETFFKSDLRMVNWGANNLELIDSIDHVHVVKNNYIYLNGLQNILSKHIENTQIFVNVVKNNDGVNSLVAYVETSTNKTEKEIINYLETELPSEYIPTHLVLINSMPKTANGFVDMDALPELWEQKSAVEQPSNPTEEHIHELWKEVLNKTDFGITETFFELGGNSLKLLDLLSKLDAEYPGVFELPDLIEFNTVKTVAAKIESSKTVVVSEKTTVVKREYYALNPSQKKMWIAEKTADIGNLYNINLAYKIDGEITADLIEKSVQGLIQRHESLRVSIEEIENKVVQKINDFDKTKFRLNYIEESMESSQLTNYLNEQGAKPFDLSQNPLIRVTLIRQAENSYILFLSVHHIISDGWSMNVIFNDLFDIYKELKTHNDLSMLKTIESNYGEYCEWLTSKVESSVFSESKEFWLNKLTQMINPTTIPYDDEVRNPGSGNIVFVLESDINEKVQAVCRKYSVTEYHIYLSVFMMLLQKYTPNSRVMMGSTSGIREQQEFRSIIGCLISVLNLSIDIIPTDTFVDLVEKVKNEVILALKHQYVDTDVLSKELNLNQTPKYLVGFTYHFENYIQSVSYENFKVEQLNTSPNDAKVDLWFNIHGSSTSVQIDVEYNNKKYNIQTINKFVERYNHLLDQVLLDSETMIKDYVLTSEIKQLCAREIETFEFGF